MATARNRYASAHTGTCVTCAFFMPGTGLYGECRARPPVVVNAGCAALFPRVTPTAWCGEHTVGGRS
jgi:hypothetical protein